MKIIFFGTSNVALPALETLHQHEEVLAVVTSPDAPVGRKHALEESPVSALAKELNLKQFKPASLKNNPQLFAELQRLAADIFVVVSYGKILPSEILNLPPHKTVNVHFSLLPQYRGPSPIQYALLAGEKISGTSIFIIDEAVDHGPLLAQKSAPVDNDDNFFTLSERLAKISAAMLVPTLAQYLSGAITPKPQDHEQATYTKIITKADGRVVWDDTAQAIYNQFRAFYLWPGIWTEWGGKKIKITEAVPATGQADAEPGTILEGGYVACGENSTLKIIRLQAEGKKEMAMAEFLNGNRTFIGSRLN